MIKFVVEIDAEYVAVTMASVGEKQFFGHRIVREGRQFRRVVRI